MENTTTTYADLLKSVSVSITPNDASFLAIILNQWLEQSELTPTPHMQNLLIQLRGEKLC